MPRLKKILERITRPFAVFMLLAVFYWGIALYNTFTVNITVDETAHIGAAQSYTSGEGLNPEHR
jgi:CHASE3 domain sensor protein